MLRDPRLTGDHWLVHGASGIGFLIWFHLLAFTGRDRGTSRGRPEEAQGFAAIGWLRLRIFFAEWIDIAQRRITGQAILHTRAHDHGQQIKEML
jgi:hypothetical protein